MPELTQSSLGWNAEGKLCVLRLPSTPIRIIAIEAAGPCFISALPEELLLKIFSFLPPKATWELTEDEEKFPLTFVSKRWRAIYDQILFRKIMINQYPRERMIFCVRKLLDILESRPHLRSYPRVVNLVLENTGISTCQNVADVLKLCTAIRKVSLHADFAPQISCVISAMKDLFLLEDLCLSGRPSVHLALETFASPVLKRLELSRYGIPSSSADLQAPWPGEPVSPSQQDLDRLLPPNRYHTGSVTSIRLSDPSTLPYVSECILRWPARLVDLSLTQFKYATGGHHYTMEAVQRLINLHRNSLKTLEIGMMVGSRTGMPDFSNFPCLMTLNMSAYNVIGSETPSNAIKKLAAPCLSYLGLSFSPEDQHSESPDDFAAEQVTWIEKFASLKKTKYLLSKLNKVAISFNPEVDPYWSRPQSSEVSEVNVWPWEHLEQAKQAAAQLRLTVDYGEPRWSKDEWNRIVQETEQEQKAAILDSD